MVQTSIPGGDGGWRQLECPQCGKSFVWNQSNDINKILTCENTHPDTGKPCGHKMPRADWEFYWFQKKRKETV